MGSKHSFKDWTPEELRLPSEPCYWCGITIRNPDMWPTCGKPSCAANTIRWLLRCIGYVPQAPKLEREDLFGLEILAFVQDLCRPRPDIGPTAMEYVIPPAARREPLSIMPKDRKDVLVWCLESWGYRDGKVWKSYNHSKPLPEYLAFQIERRVARSRADDELKRSIEGFAKEKREKLSRRLKRVEKKFDAEGIGS